jgi:isopentenyl-diphosphate delta-isomerase
LDEKIEARKTEHITIAEEKKVTSERNYWDDIRLVHQAVPDFDYDSILTHAEFLGKKFSYPIIISSMTGGTNRARTINRNLARAAETFNIPMGVGSMRACIQDHALSDTYSVINEFKVPAKFANIGAPQLVSQGKAAFTGADIEYAFKLIDASYLIVHFNFLQEMVQPEGDHNARGILKRLSEIAGSYPVIAKETGNGFSREACLLLKDAGVRAIDVGGLGGTSFAAIEFYRAKNAGDIEKMTSGETFWNWGVPSPASIEYCHDILPTIGSGGLRNGLDLAKALSLGAGMGGFARSLLKGADQSYEQIEGVINQIIRDLKITMFLTGSSKIEQLRKAKRIILDPLKTWMGVYNAGRL